MGDAGAPPRRSSFAAKNRMAGAKATDRRFLVRDEPAQDPLVARSDGSFVFDARGKRYIDFVSGWCVGNLGWGNREVRSAIRRYSGPDYVAPFHLYDGWAELAKLLRASSASGPPTAGTRWP
jgi:4-aminobutyrate aminotransferase-like enzyme